MFKVLQLKLNERAVIFKNSLPIRAVGPGRHVVWGRRITEQRFDTSQLVFRALPGASRSCGCLPRWGCG